MKTALVLNLTSYVPVMSKFFAIAALFLLPGASSVADTAPAAPVSAPAPAAPSSKVLAVTNDSGIGSDGTVQDQNSYQVRIGELHAPGGEAYILPVRIPSLPAGQHFLNVHLRAQLTGINKEGGGLASADLYGLGVRDTATILPSDYYQGPKPDAKATLLQGSFLTQASKVRTNASTGPFVETSADGDAALTKYFNDAAAKDGMTGKFIVLRISYDADPIPSGNCAYNLLTTGADGDNEPPIITYTLGPK